ncbi:MAG: V/A type ATP synthase; V/A-type H+/Na+-transporting ATPase subunit E [Treponematales bacterium]
MEELHSTEVLDREILEDARKKAFKILKAADEAAESAAAAWKEKTAQEIDGLKKSYAEKLSRAGEDIMAALPLDKRRLRSERTERLLRENMDAVLGGLDGESRKKLLERELKRRLSGCPEFESAKAHVSVRGLSAAEAQALLGKACAGAKPAVNASDAAFARAGKFPGLLLDTPQVRVIVSVDDAAETLLSEKRAELASALLGEEALND